VSGERPGCTRRDAFINFRLLALVSTQLIFSRGSLKKKERGIQEEKEIHELKGDEGRWKIAKDNKI